MSVGFGRDPIPGFDEPEAQAPPVRAPFVPEPLISPIEPRSIAVTGQTVLNGPRVGAAYPLDLAKPRLMVGRNDPPSVTVDLDFTEAEIGEIPMISRRHAVIEHEPDGAILVTDLGSTNGTWVDGMRLAAGERSNPLKAGALIKFASLELRAIAGDAP